MRKSLVLAAGTLAVLTTATMAIAASRTAARQDTPVVVKSLLVPNLGTIIVNEQGKTLYMFVPDKQSKVTCVKACAAVWPPLKASKGAKLVAGGGVKQSLLGLDPNPSGGYVVTYDKWPLYTYATDTKAGQATGQGLNSTGGLWYVLSPSGAVIKKKMH